MTACLVLFGSLEFVHDSYKIKEISENPGGLPYRYVVKGMIPLAFGMLIFTAVGYTVKNINLYRQGKQAAILASTAREDQP